MGSTDSLILDIMLEELAPDIGKVNVIDLIGSPVAIGEVINFLKFHDMLIYL